jgi:lipopolysaccharide export system permease protein
VKTAPTEPRESPEAPEPTNPRLTREPEPPVAPPRFKLGILPEIDRLVTKELLGPWVFGVAMFSALLIAATYLGRITDYVVQGISGGVIAEVTLLLLPAVLVKTFAMAVLLAALLAFGRLSSDSEIVALRAAGAGLARIVAPVAAFSMAVALVAFALNESVVPAAARRATFLQNTIAEQLNPSRVRPTSYPIIEDGRVVAMVSAQDFNLSTGTLRGATIITYAEDGRNQAYLEARELVFDAKQFAATEGRSGWRIRGGARLVGADGRDYITLDSEVWPPQIPNANFTLDDLLTGDLKEYDLMSMREMRDTIAKERLNPNVKDSTIRNMEYWYWSKLALPLAALVFGVLGATLGIRNHRTGTAAGFALAIAIIFSYFTIANFMNVWAMGGVIPPYVASFTPIAIGLVASAIIMWRRNA